MIKIITNYTSELQKINKEKLKGVFFQNWMTKKSKFKFKRQFIIKYKHMFHRKYTCNFIKMVYFNIAKYVLY